MPVGGGKGPAGGYRAGKKGSYGCKGYPTVSADGTVHGCHSTKTAAARQARAIWASVNSQKSDDLPPLTDFMKMKSVAENVEGCSGFAVVDEEGELEGCFQTREEAQAYADRENAMDMEDDDMEDEDMEMKAAKPNYSQMIKPRRGGSTPSNRELYNRIIGEAKRRFDVYPSAVANAWVVQEYKRRGGTYKADGAGMQINEGDYVMGMTSEGMVHGRVEHIMWEGGTLGQPGTEYAIESMPPENPAMSVRIFKQEDAGMWEPTAYSIGMMYQDAIRLDDLQGHMMEDEDYEMEMMYKAETFTPNSGMKAAARRALKWKEDGKATGAGTPVGWGRATDIVAGRPMSISVVRRMFSFFSRHEVDKKGKDFYNTSNPSNGRIMWDAWGGDAGFTWSRGIVNRMKDKAMFSEFGKDYTKAERLTDVFKSMKEKEEYMKRERTMATRQRLAASGAAMPDGSYPIVTVEDLRNAIQAFGRASNPQATKEHIMRRARALGRTDLIPENWK